MKKTLALFLCMLLTLSGCAWSACAEQEAPVKLSILKANDNTVWDPEGNPALAKILEDANVEIELNLAEDIKQTINLSMASGEMADIIVAPGFSFLEYVNTGYLLELSDLLEQHGQNLLNTISQQGWDYVTLDGQVYCIPQENLNSKWPTAIRSDWVEKLGYEVKETYTLSELKEMLIAFAKNDPDGNGEDDTYGMSAYGGGWKNTCLAIYGAFGGQPDQNYLNADNAFYAFNTSEDFREALAYIHELWAAGAIDPEFFVASNELTQQKAAAGKVGYFTSWWSGVRGLVEGGFVELNPEGNFKRIFITSDDGTKQGVTDNGLVTNTTFITSSCENPEAAMEFLNYLSSDEGYMLANNGMEGLHYQLDEEGRVSNIFDTSRNYIPLSGITRRLDQVRFHDARPLSEGADKGVAMAYDFQMIQYAEGMHLYTDIFYGLPVTSESLEYAMAMSYRANESFNQMIYGETIMEGDGEMRYGWDDIARRIEFKKWLYDNGYIDREYMSDTNGANAMQSFLNGKTGILPWLTSLDRNWALGDYSTFKNNVPEGKLAIMSYPEIDGVRYMPTLTNPAQITCFVNASCKNLEAVMQYVDFACSKEFAMAFTYGIEGEHYEMVDGMPVIIDNEKFTSEVSWAGDFAMLKSADTLAEFRSTTDDFDLSDPIQAEAYQLRKDALALYLDPELKYPGLTHSEHMPQLPEDLSMINANINLNQFYDRAVVGGAEYTVEMAMEDAKNTWAQGGGEQIMEWWQDWYANDRENAFLAEDMYAIVMAGNPLSYLK